MSVDPGWATRLSVALLDVMRLGVAAPKSSDLVADRRGKGEKKEEKEKEISKGGMFRFRV